MDGGRLLVLGGWLSGARPQEVMCLGLELGTRARTPQDRSPTNAPFVPSDIYAS